MKISRKLIFGFVQIALLIGVVGYVSVNVSQKALQESIGEGIVWFAKHTIHEIDENIYTRIEEMQIFAKDVSLAQEASESNEEFDRIPNVRDYINNIDRDWVAKKDTPIIQRILNNDLSKRLTRHLEFYKEKYGYAVLSEMYVTNKYGIVIASTGRTTDYLQADEEWYQKAVKEKAFWVGDPEYDESPDVLAIDIVVNLYDENEHFVGIFKSVLNIEDIKNIIDQVQATSPYKNITSYLVDKNGLVIFSGLDPAQKKLGRDIRLKEFAEDISHRKTVAQAIKSRDGFLVTIENREKLLTAFSQSKGFRDFKGLSWSLIIASDADEILAPILTLRTHLLMIFIFIVIVIIITGILVTHFISTPITKLTEAVIKISKGDLDTKIDVETNDEIGELAEAFKSMIIDLKTSRDEIHKK